VNWLAHVFLSEPDIEVRLGNLLADLVKGPARRGMGSAFLQGVQQHQAIDAFTDAHPIVHRSRARLDSNQYRYVRGILIDIFYDHFLAINWDCYCSQSLKSFTDDLYAEIQANSLQLPEPVRMAVDRLICEDLLGSYRHIEGIETCLRRVSRRLSARVGREFALEKGVSELQTHFDELASDFAAFFPLLQAYAREIQSTSSF
jgi:acyl carrier protein phosphodiesterase